MKVKRKQKPFDCLVIESRKNDPVTGKPKGKCKKQCLTCKNHFRPQQQI